MTVTKQIPQKEYPYLAVWVGYGDILDPNLTNQIKIEDIVLISMVEDKSKSYCPLPNDSTDKKPYVQYVMGGKASYFTENETEYCPLPKGYSLTFCQ